MKSLFCIRIIDVGGMFKKFFSAELLTSVELLKFFVLLRQFFFIFNIYIYTIWKFSDSNNLVRIFFNCGNAWDNSHIASTFSIQRLKIKSPFTEWLLKGRHLLILFWSSSVVHYLPFLPLAYKLRMSVHQLAVHKRGLSASK